MWQKYLDSSILWDVGYLVGVNEITIEKKSKKAVGVTVNKRVFERGS